MFSPRMLVKMMFGLTALIALGGSASAQTYPGTLHELRCFQPGVYNGLIVTIDIGFKAGGFEYIGYVEEDSYMEPRPLARFKNLAKLLERRPGSPIIYRGKNFELQVNGTVTPVEGGMPAHVVFELKDGRKFSEDLVCNFTR